MSAREDFTELNVRKILKMTVKEEKIVHS